MTIRIVRKPKAKEVEYKLFKEGKFICDVPPSQIDMNLPIPTNYKPCGKEYDSKIDSVYCEVIQYIKCIKTKPSSLEDFIKKEQEFLIEIGKEEERGRKQ